jgi:hypothetical protein
MGTDRAGGHKAYDEIIKRINWKNYCYCSVKKFCHPVYFETFCKIFFMVRDVRPMPTPPSWRTTPFRLSKTAYSVYSQLTSISGGLLLHLQHEGGVQWRAFVNTVMNFWVP